MNIGFTMGFYQITKDNGFSQIAEQTIGSIQSFRANWSDGGDRY